VPPPGYDEGEFDGNGPTFLIVEAFTRPVRGDTEVGRQVQEKMLVLSLTPAVKLRGNFVHAGAVCVPAAPAEVLAATQQHADENANESTPKYKEALVTALKTTNLGAHCRFHFESITHGLSKKDFDFEDVLFPSDPITDPSSSGSP